MYRYAQCYDYIKRFEANFATYLDTPYTIATSSCTGAIHMGLSALGIGRGDEVILADINWIATVAPIHHIGAIPVLVDIDSKSWCIDPTAVEAAITPKTKAIVATHLYGNLCDLGALKLIADNYGISLIEDAAEAIGSVYKGRKAGATGTFGTFSFHGTKTMTTGEGGIFVTGDPELYEAALTLSNHGRARGESRQFWANEVGFKYKMSNIQAAIGCAQLERIKDLIARKRAIFASYTETLSDLPITLNPEPSDCQNGYWMPTAVFSEEIAHLKDCVLEAFKANSIDGRIFFHPLSALGHFEKRFQTPVSYDITRRALNLPSYHDMTEADIQRVGNIVRSVVLNAG